MFLKFSFKGGKVSFTQQFLSFKYWSFSKVFFFFFPVLSSHCRGSHSLYAIYMLMSFEFLSLGQISFLSSRPLYLTLYFLTPLGCMTGISDSACLRIPDYTVLPSHPTFLRVPILECPGTPLLFTYPMHIVCQQVLLTLLSENILNLFTSIQLHYNPR